MKFRPCIDLHDGVVKQIVGSTLSDSVPQRITTNFIAEKPPAWFAGLYRDDNLTGGHIIKLGVGNDRAALEALGAWPGGMQLGGGVTAENAAYWIDNGASHVIVTSYVFRDGKVDMDRLAELVRSVGSERLVLDLSCRKKGDSYYIVTDRWQKFTKVRITPEILRSLGKFCAEFLIHAADVEGKCSGIEADIVALLGESSPVPATYAGGISGFDDLELIRDKGEGKIDFTVGSALDIFGGTLLCYRDTVEFCKNL
ncbi:phosphoribosylformimino-5-aminoimidazole carboxamide ribotide isomerase [Desulforhopalus singaporensis]|uniref:1-(5-phosphoribosyl)-5-[(5-phosphoribosylamino)methylideneamino] imidazole-4-carboxamide isomerase n=1 Tax=Desulforhopalus singaporensis TaxID=91360 RepID=A0A1H0TAA4_9BACT|nr:phosphoribosylformimino-5-aminoimidazole carboxamide ribotide isomerase [Desulforhopalus singaporensis]SDP50957.1 1-(5-phosphoribosyl)-5-[(5-phosphoribosylamino)methylideneamino] imidazole-4-carboxamide isomerase [Desulforhopalus singaporensis]